MRPGQLNAPVRRRRAYCAALALSLLLCAPAHNARAYDGQDMQNAIEGYLLGHLGKHGQAAMRLYRAARDTGSLEVFADATREAVMAGDYQMAADIARTWYDSGGGVPALRQSAALHADQFGPLRSLGILSKLAEEAKPRNVYSVLSSLDKRWHGEAAEAMLSSHPTHLRNTSFWSHLALLQLRAGATEKAATATRTALDADPSSQLALSAALRVARNNDDKALRVALADRLAAAAGMPLADALAAFGVWNWEFNNTGKELPENLSELTSSAHALAGTGYYDRSRIGAGRFLQDNGEPQRALGQYRQISTGSPLSGHAIDGQLKVLELLGRNDEARQLADRALADAVPERAADTALIIAAHQDRINGPQQAHDFLAAMAAHADNLQVLYQRSLYAEKADRLDQVELALREYIRLAPGDAEGYNALGYILADKNIRLQEAEELIRKALQISPDAPNIIDSLGWLLYRLGRYDEALEVLNKAMRTFGEPPPAEVAAHIGEVLWVTGEQERAHKLWMGARKRDPDNKVLLDTISRFSEFSL